MGMDQSHDRIDRGGLSRTITSDQGDYLSLGNLEVNSF
jgi:hypothetical protein